MTIEISTAIQDPRTNKLAIMAPEEREAEMRVLAGNIATSNVLDETETASVQAAALYAGKLVGSGLRSSATQGQMIIDALTVLGLGHQTDKESVVTKVS